MKRLAVLLVAVVCISLFMVGCVGTKEVGAPGSAEPVAEMVPMNAEEYKNEIHKIMSVLAGDKDIYVKQYGYAVNGGSKEGKQNAALQLNTQVLNAYGDITDLGLAPDPYAKDIDAISKALFDASQYFIKASDSLTPEADAETAWQDGLARLDEALSITYELIEK